MLDPKNIGPGQEQHEYYRDRTRKRTHRCAYDYRAENGELFSCVAPTLEEARMRRDDWLEKRGAWMKMV